MTNITKTLAPSQPSRRGKIIKLSILYLFSIVIVVLSMHYFLYDDTGIFRGRAISESLWYRIGLRMHILFGMVAMLLGPIQMIKVARGQTKQRHRSLGYAYAVSVYLSGLFGLIVAQFSLGGLISGIGFTLLALAWMYTMTMAIITIRRRQVIQHRMWMLINYTLTFAAVPQRLMLLLAFIPGGYFSFQTVYHWSAYLPWMGGILVALWIHHRTKDRVEVPFGGS